MANSPSSYGGEGAISLPVAIAGPTEALVDCVSPLHVSMEGLVRAALNAELEEVWTQILRLLPPDHFLKRDQANVCKPVSDAVRQYPAPAMLQQRLSGWPLLATYREPDGSETFRMSLTTMATRQKWAIDWILGPIDASETEFFNPLGEAVAAIIKTAIAEQAHPAYRDFEAQFWGQCSSIHAVGHSGPGIARFLAAEGKELGFFCVSVAVETVERQMKTDGHAMDNVFKHYSAYSRPRTVNNPTVARMELDIELGGSEPEGSGSP